MLTSNSLLFTSSYYPPSPPLSSSKASMSPPNAMLNTTLNLEKVVQNYGHQPELLELILASKVQEDRRRAEEAKLRQKEIDYLLKKESKPQQQQQKSFNSILPPINTLPRLQQSQKRYTPVDSWPSPPPKRRNSSSIEMLLSSSPKTEFRLPKLSPPPISNKRSYTYQEEDSSRYGQTSFSDSSAPSSPVTESSNAPGTKRRRREMQAISTIIETREYPYNDDYLWKNNGNTVHKKTGFKSIYYKCSNSAKGCLVNKTVTFKDNGEYLIKYRGQHLPECHRIKRITDL